MYHERQAGLWCGLHSLNNALQYSFFKPEDAHREARRQLNAELHWARVDRSEFDWQLVSCAGNLDISVIRTLLENTGHPTCFVRTFGQAYRLVSHQPRGTRRRAFVCHVNGNHYIALTSYGHRWFYHDSLDRAPREVTAGDIVFGLFPPLCRGNRHRFGRRILYFEPL